MRILHALIAVVATSVLCASLDAFAIPNCRSCPYSCSDLGLGKKDCSYLSETKGVCCVDLSNKGLDIANAQASVLEKQQALVNQNERCPAGFTQSEQRCTDRERKAGCKDIRLPNGIGCVRR